MTRTIVLAAHSLRRSRTILVAMAVVLGAFQFLLTQVGVYLTRSQAFGTLTSLVPEFVRSLAGPSMIAFMSFRGVIGLGYSHPIVLASLVGLAIAVATEPAAEAESRFGDLTLARPLARHQIISRTLIVLVVAETALLLVMAAASAIGLACCAPATDRPPVATIAWLAAALGIIVLCWGGIALAIAAGARRRASAAGSAAIVTLAAYLIDYLGRVWDPARLASKLSPFHYFEPMAIVSAGSPAAADLVVLLAVAGAAAAVGYWRFSRRDL